jgi:hypothetical protein
VSETVVVAILTADVSKPDVPLEYIDIMSGMGTSEWLAL